MSNPPKYAIDLISGKLTSSEKSHKNGWAQLRKCQLEDELNVKIDVLHGESWDDYDVIFLYHGMEQDGETLNLFGGATGDNAAPYERLIRYQEKSLFSLDIPMPDYGKLCLNRLKNCDKHWSNVDWESISRICNNDIVPLLLPAQTNKLVIGDSHAFSAYQSDYMVCRKDGRTLAGVLKKTLRKEIEDFCPGLLDRPKVVSTDEKSKRLTHLTVYYGNIDIRHHICRHDSPLTYVDELLKEYEKQLIELDIPNIEIVCPLPIEDESRKLPKTGYFKGTPFYGSWMQRTAIVMHFIHGLKQITERNGWKLFTWNRDWYTMDSIEYMKTIMESPKSVHLAPKYHRWNYWKNELNDYKFEESKVVQLFDTLIEY